MELGNRGMAVEAARQCAKKNGRYAANFAGPVVFRTALSCSGGYHPERGGMPLHDAVGINEKGHNYLKTRRRCQVYTLRCVC